VITVPPHEWPTNTTLPVCASSTRRVTAASSFRDVSGFWIAVTFTPFACSSGMTLAQSEPSAKAPWTMTTDGVAGAAAWAAPVKAAAARAIAPSVVVSVVMVFSWWSVDKVNPV
jgi:hypothetical protein